MTAPQLIERNLTFSFAQSVSVATGQPDILQVSIIPLADASNPSAGATFAGGVKTQSVELTNVTNVVTFQLLPSNAPGNSESVNYRVMWRAGVMGRTFTFDFAMPDADITWENLVAGTGNIIDGAAYLQQSDLGVPGRVARLNDQGLVVDASGTPVATEADVATVSGALSAETNQRQAGDTTLANSLGAQIASQATSLTTAYQNYVTSQIASVNGDLAAERGQRISVDAGLQIQINDNFNSLNNEITNRTNLTTTINETLSVKADLDNTGHVPVGEIPEVVFTNAFPVMDQTTMLALPASQGDVAVRPDGVWLLNGADPTALINWVSLTTVSSVNGRRGQVQIAASDVGAIPVGGSVTQTQVVGLSTALSNKANTSDLAAITATVAAIQTDPTLVHTVAGVVPTTLMSSSMVYLNTLGQLVKKDGTIIPLGSGGSGAVFSVNGQTGLVALTAASVGAIAVGGSITQGQVTGLSTALGLKADLSALTATNNALTNKADLVTGLVPLSQIPVLPQTQVNNLSTTLSGNQLTASTNAVNRIASLEATVALGGGGGGGGGTSTTSTFYTDPNTTTEVTDLTTVVLHSPWGIDSDGMVTGTTGTWYYLYTGVRSTDVAYPFISMNGHLQLHKWDESGPADPTYALESDVLALTTTVGTKANQTDLIATNAALSAKANQTDLTALGNTVSTLATAASVNALSTTVSTKANASDLATTNATVATKANTTDLNTLSTTVGTKANSSDLATTNSNVAAINTALSSKADLVGGFVPVTQLPSLAQSKVIGLATSLTAKADLVSGTVPLSEIPTNIPTTSVFDASKSQPLSTTLGAKADLVGGVVPLSQIPTGALPNVVQVTSQAGMLALTAAQVQPGDICLITAGVNQGTYILSTASGQSDPSILGDWIPLSTGSAPVTQVNGQTGNVVLTAASVGALDASLPVAASSAVSGSTLATTLANAATIANLASGLSTKTAPADVQAMLYTSNFTKRADYVSVSAIATLSGLFAVDGVTLPSGSIVLCTAQASAANNGLWVASGGGWSRPADYASGKFVAKDTLVIVSNQTGSPSGANNESVWQITSILDGGVSVTGGFIDTDPVLTTWARIGWMNSQYAPIQGNGISITGSSSGGTFSAVAPTTVVGTGGTSIPSGIVVSSAGISADILSIPRKFVYTTNGTEGNIVSVTHNLATTSPHISIWDNSVTPNVLVLAGATITNANTLSVEFASIVGPGAGHYRICIVG
jgi:hypothetical protein